MIYSTKLKNDGKNVSGKLKAKIIAREKKTKESAPLAKTWYQLNTLSSNISSPLQIISYHLDNIFAAPNWHNISKRKGMRHLLVHFRNLYDQPDLLWKDIEELLSYLTHPVDRQLVWFYPLSELLKDISKEQHTQQATLKRLCQQLGVQFHIYNDVVIDDGVVLTKSKPSITGANKRVCHSIASIAVEEDQWIMLSKDPLVAAKHNNVSRLGLTRTAHNRQVTLEDIERITHTSVKPNEDIARLNEAIKAKNYLQIAKLLESEKKCFSKINVQSFVESGDLALILTMSTFSLDMRNKLLSEPQKYKYVILSMLEIQKKIDADFKVEQWPGILDKYVPSVMRVEGDSELHKAIRKGDSNRVVELIKAGKDFYYPNQAGNTALHLACYFGMAVAIEEMIAVVIANTKKKGWLQRSFADGLKINLQNHEGATPVHFAVQCPNTEVVKALLDKDRNPTNIQSRILEVDTQGRTAVHEAVNHPEDVVLEVVLAYIKRVNLKPAFGEGYIAVKVQDKRGLTALHIATLQTEHPQRAIDLIEMGADPFQDAQYQFRREKGKEQSFIKGPLTPFALALETGHCDAIQEMLKLDSALARHPWVGTKYKALRTENSNGMNVPGIFAYYGRIDLLRPLVFNENAAILVQYQDSKGRVPIHLAAMRGNYDTFIALLKQSEISLLQLRDTDGLTALHHASENGHDQIVEKICELSSDHDKEKSALAQRAKNNQFLVNGLLLKAKKKLVDMKGDVNLNETTNDGLTAYMLASINNQAAVLSVLQKYGVDQSYVTTLVLKIINRSNLEGLEPDQIQRQMDRDQTNLARIASKYCASELKDFIFRHPAEPSHSANGNTLVHFCVLAMQYRHIRILLHPLSVSERQSLCDKKNAAGQTAYDLVKDAIIKTKIKIESAGERNFKAKLKGTLSELEKIQRYLVQWMPQMLDRLTAKETREYKSSWRQDMRGELISTSGYQTASNLMYWGPMAWKAVEAITTKRYIWCAGEAIFGQYIGGDVLQTTERGVRFVQGYLPEDEYQWLNKVADGLNAAGWVTQTVNRTVIELMKQSFAYGGRLYFEQGHEGGNYLNALNAQGFVLGLTEGMYHQISPSVNQRLGFTGVDTLILPKQGGINGLTKTGLTKVNDLIAEYTSIDIKSAVKQHYQWARKNIGGVVSASDIFDNEFADKLKEGWALEDQELESEYLGIAKLLFEDSYDYGHADVTGKQLQILTYYVNTGIFIEGAYQIFANASYLMQQNGDNPSEILFQLITQSKLVNSIKVDDESQSANNEQLKRALEEIDYSDPESALSALKLAVSQNHDPILLKDIDTQKTKIAEDVLKDSVLLETAQELIDAVIDDPERDAYEKHRDVRFLVAFIYTGNFYGNEDEFLQGLEQAGLEPSIALAEFYFNSYGYKVFGLDAEVVEESEAELAKSVQEAIDSEQPVTEVIEAFSRSVAEQFVDQRLIHSEVAPEITDEAVLNTIQTGILPTILTSIGNPTETDKTLRGVLELVHGGFINESNVGLIDSIAENLTENGIDPAEALPQLLLNSKGYEDVGFNKETKEQHSRDLQNVIHQAVDDDKPLSGVLLGAEYLYPISKAGKEEFDAKYGYYANTNVTDANTTWYIINCAFDGFAAHPTNARNEVAKSIANTVILFKFPGYPEIGDKASIEAYRDNLANMITNDYMKYFNSKPKKCKQQLYDFIYQQLTGVAKVKSKWWEKPLSIFLSGEPGVSVHAHSGGGFSGNINYLNQPVVNLFNTQPVHRSVGGSKPSIEASNTTMSQIDIEEATSMLPSYLAFPFGKPGTYTAVVLGEQQQSIIDGLLTYSPALDPANYSFNVIAAHTQERPNEPQTTSTGQQLAELNASPMVQATLSQPIATEEDTIGINSTTSMSTHQSLFLARFWFAKGVAEQGGANFVKISEYAQTNFDQLFRGKIPELIYDANEVAAFVNTQIYRFLTFQPTILDEGINKLYTYGQEEYRRFKNGDILIAQAMVQSFADKPLEEQMRLLGHEAADAMMLAGAGGLAGNLFKVGTAESLLPAYSTALTIAGDTTATSGRLSKQMLLNYLENIHTIPRPQLIRDLESIGLRYTQGSGDGRFCKFAHKTEDIRVEIHAPHFKSVNGAKYDHIHIKDKYGNYLNKNLQVVDRRSPEAHIEIKELADLILEVKPK